jgi:cell division protein FtsB
MRFLRPFRKKYLFYLMGIIAALLFFILFGGRSLMQICHLKEDREKIRIANARLREENQKLAEQIQRMKHDKKEEVEKIAREELGLVKKGEVVYQFEK